MRNWFLYFARGFPPVTFPHTILDARSPISEESGPRETICTGKESQNVAFRECFQNVVGLTWTKWFKRFKLSGTLEQPLWNIKSFEKMLSDYDVFKNLTGKCRWLQISHAAVLKRGAGTSGVIWRRSNKSWNVRGGVGNENEDIYAMRGGILNPIIRTESLCAKVEMIAVLATTSGCWSYCEF